MKHTHRKPGALRQTALLLGSVTVGLIVLTGCHTDMWVQPKPKPQAESDFFADGVSSRPPVPHAVARGDLRTDDAYWRGATGREVVAGQPAGLKYINEIPDAVYNAPEFKSDSKETSLVKILKRGQDRFNIFCSPCHSRVGDGEGMIAKRGLNAAMGKRPPGNYHTDRLRKMPLGYFYDVMTNGYGTMTPRAFQVEHNDRWAIAAYIRVLQLSQNAQPADLTPDDQNKLNKALS
ncbi:MAG TPA: cytochrome c, partial [Chthonomonadaceae bacterium]|nr:cytochrome c [Chthonomonadaceae bacterium]